MKHGRTPGFYNCKIGLGPGSNFKFMQIDYPRWLSGAVTKNNINTKMTISLEPLVEIDPTL